MRNTVLITFVLCVLPLWWILQILWLPGFMHGIAGIAYRFEPNSIPASTASLARERAYTYATRGGSQSEDIYFSRDEISHLVDVSHLYTPISLILNILTIISWSVLFLAIYKKVQLQPGLILSSKILTGLLVTLSICILAFGAFFEKFHQILFPQGNWAFPQDSLLITIFPETFWKLELLSILLFLIVFIGLYRILGHLHKSK